MDGGRYLRDERHLLNIFPEEVWRMILDQIEDNNDLVSVTNASLYFRSLLLGQRVHFLFPKVWAILGMKWEEEREDDVILPEKLEEAAEEEDKVTEDVEGEGRGVKRRKINEEEEEDMGSKFEEDDRSSKLEEDDRSSKMEEYDRSSKMEEDGPSSETDFDSMSGAFSRGDDERTEDDDEDSEDYDELFSGISDLSYFPDPYSDDMVVSSIRKWFHRILQLRMVCRSWRDAIDSFYQNLPHHYRMTQDETAPCGHMAVGNWAQLELLAADDMDYLHKVIDHFEDSHGGAEAANRNPFRTRNIPILYNGGLENQDYFNLLSTFLNKYGHHFWYCDLYPTDTFPSRIAYYSKLREILQLLPNLKVLSIQRHCWPRDMSMAEELQFEMDLNPLPKLKNLEYLKIRSLSTVFFNQLIASNSHISMLEIQRCNETSIKCNKCHGEYDISSSHLPNLKQLSMGFYTGREFFKLGLPEVNWRLDKLYLDFESCNFISWSRIFSLLWRKFGESLTNVTLVLPKAMGELNQKKILEECSSYKLDLPNVKRLKLTLSNYTSLDFILPMGPSLESLEIVIRCDFRKMEVKYKSLTDAVKKGQFLQFLDYFGKEHGKELDSNVWGIFPHLDKLKVSQVYSDRTEGKRGGNSSVGQRETNHVSRFTRMDWRYWNEW